MEHSAWILYGGPGYGKGKLSKILESQGHHLVCMGDILSEYKENNAQVAATIASGKLVSSELIHDLLLEHTPEPHPELKLVFDGATRRLDQAKRLVDMLHHQYGCPVAVINIEVDPEVATIRLLKRGREDDIPQSIKKRLMEYQENAPAVIAYLNRRCPYSFYEINNNGTENALLTAFIDVIKREKKRTSPVRQPFSSLSISSP